MRSFEDETEMQGTLKASKYGTAKIDFSLFFATLDQWDNTVILPYKIRGLTLTKWKAFTTELPMIPQVEFITLLDEEDTSIQVCTPSEFCFFVFFLFGQVSLQTMSDTINLKTTIDLYPQACCDTKVPTPLSH